MSGLRVLRCGPSVTVQDRGRPGHLAEGLPPSGALVPEGLRLANAALGNPLEAACVEVPQHGASFRAEGAITVALDDARCALDDGATLELRPAPWAVRYLALPGGVDVPLRLGSRSTLLVASLGGFEGRALRRGDLLRALDARPGAAPDAPLAPRRAPPEPLAVEVVRGPNDLPPCAWEALLAGLFRVSAQGDRVGVRLEGPAIVPDDGARGLSRPMVRGAIEVTPDGGLIVLGPDHPTTGGYPLVGVVARASQGPLADLRPGASLRFVAADGY